MRVISAATRCAFNNLARARKTVDSTTSNKIVAIKIGFEVSFTRHFYKPQRLRTLDEIRADILATEEEAGGLLDEIIGGHA